MVPSRSSLPASLRRRMSQIVLLLVAVVAASPAAEADLWYQHYQRAEKALEDEDWSGAIRRSSVVATPGCGSAPTA
jgi:hypothetical protein